MNKVTTYTAYPINEDETYYIDVATQHSEIAEDAYVSWIYRFDLPVKMFLCGAPASKYPSEKEFFESTKRFWDLGIKHYESEISRMETVSIEDEEMLDI